MSLSDKTRAKIENKLKGYKFDTSKYIVMQSGVHRDAISGKLVVHDSNKGKAVSSAKLKGR